MKLPQIYICNAIAPYRRVYGYITLAYQHAIPAGTCPEPVTVFPYIPYLLTYPSGGALLGVLCFDATQVE